MRIAVFSDAHGNLPALRAVLNNIKKEGSFDAVICAGDLIGGGSSVAEMVELCEAHQVQCILGNYEQLLLDYQKFRHRVRPEDALMTDLLMQWMSEKMTPALRDWINRLPLHIDFTPAVGKTLTVCHASPLDCWQGGGRDLSDAQLSSLYGSWDARWIAFGHVHGSFVTTYKDKVLANISSVSQIRDFSSYSTYCILEYQSNRWSISVRKTEFDIYESFKNIREANLPAELLWRAQPFY